MDMQRISDAALEQAKPTREQACAPRCVDSRELFDRRNVVVIRHGDQDYVLRLTRNGKLILTK
jgi:hemin uptake protein HemP